MMRWMRTTVTIDPDVEAMLSRFMKTRQMSFKEAINTALRSALLAGLGTRRAVPVKLPVFQMKQRAGINLDKALQLSGELEDEEILRKMAARK